jgi:Protein of unknown function (DUF1236)
MKRLYLLSTVAASLLLAAGSAAAQQGTPLPVERAPAAQQHAPAEKMAPSMHAGQRHGAATVGQGAQGMSSTERGKAGTSGKAETNGQASGGVSAGGETQMHHGPKASGKMQMKGEAQTKGQGSADTSAKGKTGMGQESAKSGRHNSSTSGQGAAATHAKLTTEQRTKITTIIKGHHPRSVHVNFSVRVGARVPARVHFYPLPVAVIDVYPEWRGYDYILVSSEILVIDPRTHLIVAVLEA